MTNPIAVSQRAREAANKLTAARKAMILALPTDGGWGPVPSRAVAKRAWYNMLPMVIDHKHCPEDANEWSLTDYGIQLATAIRNQKDHDHE